VSDIREIIDKIKGIAKHANKIVKLLQAYEKVRAQPIENAYVLEKKFAEIEKILALLSNVALRDTLNTWLQNERATISKLKDDFRFQFGQQIKGMFQKNGVKIRGQYPLLRIGLFTLKLNFEFGEATLFFGPEVEKLKSKIPLQPQVIHSTVQKYKRNMQDASFDANKAYDDLYAAYQRCLEVSGKPDGEKVRITEILKEYVFLKQPKQFMVDPSRGHFREYSRIKLSYMLYRMKTADVGARGMRFHVATFDATVDKLRSFWIPNNDEGEGTHYEYISFELPHE
jgi:hypothetical protein